MTVRILYKNGIVVDYKGIKELYNVNSKYTHDKLYLELHCDKWHEPTYSIDYKDIKQIRVFENA